MLLITNTIIMNTISFIITFPIALILSIFMALKFACKDRYNFNMSRENRRFLVGGNALGLLCVSDTTRLLSGSVIAKQRITGKAIILASCFRIYFNLLKIK